ncbi:MAG: FKBP-type peptidyl-prolyl cis-trans isomerase [Prevotella sp.]|nr:FKBP-type peptidyl-prolyl cis-trans isomerase [Prevotella sp.]
MEKKENKHIEVAYDLFTIDESGRHLVEKAPEDKPFVFVSGFGIALEGFEEALVSLQKGEEFNFTLAPEQAYGEFYDERVVELDREIFSIDGRFDHERIYIDAIVPLQNEDGDRFMGRVIDIRDNSVVIDLNHPLAGKSLNFVGKIVESQEAREEEIQQLIRQLTGQSCGGCGGCGDGEEGCGGCGKEEGGCGNQEGGCCKKG